MEYLQFGCQVLLGGVFAVSAGSKLYSRTAFAEFAAATARLSGAGAGRARQLAVAVVAAEIAIVLALIVHALWGFALGIGLLAVFSAAIVRSLRKGQRASCRCFGASNSPLGPQHVVRNIVLAAFGVLGIAANLSEPTSSTDIGLACVVAFAALIGVGLTARLDDLMGLFRVAATTSQLGKQQ
ncbi:hypothetical protein BWI15_04625 [Kribbella sp. ALI-6-A]|nr:hypothetical protein BWI15_04625 [Kribbella sp. ALI-6-A]